MGWTTCYSWNKLPKIISHLTENETNSSGTIRECLNHCYRGASFKGTLWTVWSITRADGTKFKYIGCDLIQYYKGDLAFGYKDMEASMHPYKYNCPLSYLLIEGLDYPPDKGNFIDWVGGVLLNYKNKNSPIYKKALEKYPNALEAYKNYGIEISKPMEFKKQVFLSK